MKRTIKILFVAVWVFNLWLWLAMRFGPVYYDQLRANGAQWFNCIDWDENGHSFPSDQCIGDPPPYTPSQEFPII